MLTEQQCRLIEAALTQDVEPRKVAAYLCLHMGLMLGEVAALRMGDINLYAASLTLRGTVAVGAVFTPLSEARVLPLPPHVIRYMRKHRHLYADDDCFLFTGERSVPSFHPMQNILTSIAKQHKVAKTLSASDLRNAFIRRCLQNGMDLYSVCAYVGIKQPNVIAKRFAVYLQPRYDGISLLERFSMDYKPPQATERGAEAAMESHSPKRMNLLILGAGSQGPVVREIAEAIGIFDEIAFLDDDPGNRLAMGPLSDISKLAKRFPMATASFGDSCLRETYMNVLEENGYITPSLIHPNATVSPNAALGRAIIVEARCVVAAGAAVGRGALLSSASVIEPNASIGRFAHIGSSVTVAMDAVVQDYQRIPSGTVVRAR